MPTVRALYFPRLYSTPNYDPSPRFVRVEVTIEERQWRADVHAFFPISETEHLIIEGPSRSDVRPCGGRGEVCVGTARAVMRPWTRLKTIGRTKENAHTAYAMAFAATPSMEDYRSEEPLLEREPSFEEERDNCWDREFLFFKLRAGYPIDIGSPTLGCCDLSSHLVQDMKFLKFFFGQLVRDKALVLRRFAPPPPIESLGYMEEAGTRQRWRSIARPSTSQVSNFSGSLGALPVEQHPPGATNEKKRSRFLTQLGINGKCLWKADKALQLSRTQEKPEVRTQS